jgi:hypothetical protein
MSNPMLQLCKACYRRTIPSHWQKRLLAARKVYRILNSEYGYFRSVATEHCADALGRPLPWYTYPSIEYLNQLDFSKKCVFEYGSGQSTLFWAARAERVCSVEHNDTWCVKVRSGAPPNSTIILRPDPGAYCLAIDEFPQAFDVIVIDGPLKGRLDCAHRAVKRLAPGGIIVLDNSNWLPRTAAYLRNEGYLQVDFTGFGPAGVWTWTTSIYFDRTCRLEPKRGVQPARGMGSVVYETEEAAGVA